MQAARAHPAPDRSHQPQHQAVPIGRQALFEHGEANWVGYRNDTCHVLLLMNYKEDVTVAGRPRETHLDVYTRVPRLPVNDGRQWNTVEPARKGLHYMLDLPAGGSALPIWERTK